MGEHTDILVVRDIGWHHVVFELDLAARSGEGSLLDHSLRLHLLHSWLRIHSWPRIRHLSTSLLCSHHLGWKTFLNDFKISLPRLWLLNKWALRPLPWLRLDWLPVVPTLVQHLSIDLRPTKCFSLASPRLLFYSFLHRIWVSWVCHLHRHLIPGLVLSLLCKSNCRQIFSNFWPVLVWSWW